MSRIDAINIIEWMTDKHIDVLLLQETAHSDEDITFLTASFRGNYSYWTYQD